ncbi:DAK2 domain-containing protein [Oscillibacter sp. MSJ-2]|uniref:DAK2 domain-containing protein n=1 Tax=Dysosmobacter acutus TaxID=2841504 RepID=A0ABS6F9L6_9FIRM|nr:DAK2 domain-containing protein [Dysosmobacter acutus]MBU5626321.1 DAK2 domain-containing protein [Dysosmobacter acutus]
MNEQLTGALFKQMVLHGAAAITIQKQAINDLNVFPVPDGDTGTNMSMTINTAVAELKKSDPQSLEQAASITASALLRGARGNSGVILSLLFRGLSKSLKGMESADSAAFANAMQEGVASAYKAVMKPAEGTVLTVSRLAAKRACEVAAETQDIEKVLEEAIAEGYATLDQTIEMNPVLKKAGVVDAGGKGYLIVLEGMLAAMRGEPLPEINEESHPQEKADFAALTDEEITFTFDTVFIVRRIPGKSIEPLRSYLSGIGDSLVIGEDDDAFKVHVHTDIPGAALTESQKYGTLELAKIENMRTQYEDMAAGRKTQSVDDLEAEEPSAPAEPPKEFGFLAVCAGDGLAALFKDLGADGVVSGGQTMNPSTESILKEIERINARTVFVLPNNGNIIMAAQQCAGLTSKEVVVIPTKTVPQGITAMMNVDFDAEDAQQIADAMADAIGAVTTAQITYAARNSDFDGFAISEGDYLALEEGKLFGTDRDITALLGKLAEDAASREASFVSLFFGEDVSEEDASVAADLFQKACPEAEISVLSGGQPVYYYIISME